VVQNNNPPSYADIRVILGEQRSGKSTIGVAFAKDDYYEQLSAIQSPSGNLIKAKCLKKEDFDQLRNYKIIPDVFKHVRVFSDDDKQSKIIWIPKGYQVISPVKIFANFHIFGLRAAFISLADVIQYINSDLMTNCWVLSDESVMNDARNSMDGAGKIAVILGAQVGKRNIHMCLMSQYLEMIERRYRLFRTMTVNCTYEEADKIITCEIKRRDDPVYTVYVYAPRYWVNFDTGELIKVPERKQASAYQKVAPIPQVITQ
jgi:hypothetical protein